MKLQRLLFVVKTAVLTAACAGAAALSAAQQSAPTQQHPTSGLPADSAVVIKSESRLVLVDTIITDKKGGYVHDLTAKDFRVWEDDKEQQVKTFSFEADPASPSSSQKHYLVLLFDNSTLSASNQAYARQAAIKFIDGNTGPNRLIAVMDFGGTLHIAQNFTADAERLKQVVNGVKFSAVSANPGNSGVEVASLGAPPSMPMLSGEETDFAVRDVLLALRTLAKNLQEIPGRKTLVFLSAGFSLTPEERSELTAVIDQCNKANVAIYPIDARGLFVEGQMGRNQRGGASPWSAASEKLSSAVLQYRTSQLRSVAGSGYEFPAAALMLSAAQHGGGGGGGGGGGHGGFGGGGSGGTGGGSSGGGSTGGGSKGGTGGTTGGTGGGTTGGRGGAPGNLPNNGQLYGSNPYNQPRQIIPPVSTEGPQQVLDELTQGTGGFLIKNTNDLLGGLEKIGKEQSEYYVIGYSPSPSPEGSCHTLKVKVDRGGTNVRSRSGYCNVRAQDLLAGNVVEKTLESQANGSMAGNVTASMEAPYFYTGPNTARVNLAMEIPANSLKFEKQKGKMHSAINVLGIAYKADDSIAARFSDTVNLDFDDKKQVEEFQKQPLHYENQFDIACGQYKLKVVFSSGNESFGKLETPLDVDAYSGKQFSLSGVALSHELHKVTDEATGLDSMLLEDRTPLMVKGMQITPSGDNRFKKTDSAAIYVEVYDPLLTGTTPPKVTIALSVADRKTNGQMVSGVINLESYMLKENPVIPIGLKLPLTPLAPGGYRVKLQASDTAGNRSVIRTVDFDVE